MSDKNWVIVRFANGTVKVWRDYGTAWASLTYTVLDYFTGTYRDARKHAKATNQEVKS